MRRIEVVAALLGREGRVLVQLRPPSKARAALWEFPGGKIEPGELPERALVRECREELGLEVEVGPLVWSTTHRYEDLEVDLKLYRCRSEGTPEPREGQTLAFRPPAELLGLPFVAADVPVLALLASGAIAL